MFKENVEALVDRLENLLVSKTIVGDPVVSGDITIIPVMSVGFGFGIGSGEGPDAVKGGGKGSGGGGGGSVRPVALVVIQDGDVKVYSVGQKGFLEQLGAMVPEILAKVASQGHGHHHGGGNQGAE